MTSCAKILPGSAPAEAARPTRNQPRTSLLRLGKPSVMVTKEVWSCVASRSRRVRRGHRPRRRRHRRARGRDLGPDRTERVGQDHLAQRGLRRLRADGWRASSWAKTTSPDGRHIRSRLGDSRTFQNIKLFTQLTVRENVEAAVAPGTEESSVDEVLAGLGLARHRAREGRQPPLRQAAPARDRTSGRPAALVDPARRTRRRDERIRVR